MCSPYWSHASRQKMQPSKYLFLSNGPLIFPGVGHVLKTLPCCGFLLTIYLSHLESEVSFYLEYNWQKSRRPRGDGGGRFTCPWIIQFFHPVSDRVVATQRNWMPSSKIFSQIRLIVTKAFSSRDGGVHLFRFRNEHMLVTSHLRPGIAERHYVLVLRGIALCHAYPSGPWTFTLKVSNERPTSTEEQNIFILGFHHDHMVQWVSPFKLQSAQICFIWSCVFFVFLQTAEFNIK